MSTLRITNIEAKADPSSPTVDEKIKLTNSNGDILVHIDGKTSGITTIGINTTAGNIKFDQNSNVVVTGIITATKFVGTIEPTTLTVGGDLTIPDKIVHTGDTNTSIRFPAADTITAETGGSERLRILSDGKVAIGGVTANSLLDVHGGDGISITHSGDTFLQSRTTGTTGTNYLEFKDSGGAAGAISYHHSGDSMRFKINGAERARITSSGIIKCGTSATLKAEINSAIGGHQFISQCSDNNNGFEIYQQHGSTTTRNTFAVYANTGGGGAQELQFSVRGDGCVTKPTSPAFSASLSSGNLNAANYNNVIIFNNQQFDNSNSYNTGNGRFTAPVAGKYYFGVQIYAGFDFSGVRVLHSKFVKNGSDFATADMFGGTSNHGGTYYHPTGCGHILIDLAVNDWVAFNSGGFSASGTGNALIYAQGGTRFFGYLVG